MDLLRPERHEDGAAFRGQRPQSMDASQAIRQNGIQAVLLLVAENGETAELFLRDGLQGLRIRVKLLQAVRDMNERHTGEHEPLVAGSQIFQQVFRFGAHLLQVIGNRRCEIVLPVLPLLPACNVRFHAEDSALHLTHSFFGGNRKNVNGQQQVSGEVRQVLYHFVADKRCVVAHKKHPSKFAAHFKIPGAELQPVRADQVAEVDAALDVRGQVKPERRFFARSEEVMQEPQPVSAGNGIGPGIQPPKAGRQVGIDAPKICAGLLDFAQTNRQRDIFFLHQIVAFRSLVQNDLVVFSTVIIQTVATLRHEHRALKIDWIQAAVDDRDFRGCIGRQRIEDSAIRTEDAAPVVQRGRSIVDVRKAPRFTVLLSDLPDAVREDAADGNGLLDTAWNPKRIFLAAVCSQQGFHHSNVSSIMFANTSSWRLTESNRRGPAQRISDLMNAQRNCSKLMPL